MTPEQYCRQVCKKSGSSFTLSFLFLGKKKRCAIEAFYAFCREVDDAVDEAKSKEEAKAHLAQWRRALNQLVDNSTNPVIQALAPAVREFNIPVTLLEEIINGCEMDLEKTDYKTFEELQTYCYRVASCVGLTCLYIFGVQLSERTKQSGIDLGYALQLTNIIRDVRTDLSRGRIYLPDEDLKKFNVTKKDLENPSAAHLQLMDLLYFESDRAKVFFRQTWEFFPKNFSDRRKMFAAILMGRFYEAILAKIRHDPLQIFQNKIKLTKQEKIKITLQELCKLIFNEF